VKAGATFLLNLSNEAWFGTSAEHDHMELQSVLRAVETRRALFRACSSGISCLVRPDGRRPQGADRLVVGGSDRGVAGTFAARVPLYDGLTPYVRWGDWIGWVALAASALFLFRFKPKRLP
jgi:apolipoprotein N-acyltransferase